MPWTWRYEKADGTVITADELQEAIFASQGDAESWLGENWRALLAAGGRHRGPRRERVVPEPALDEARPSRRGGPGVRGGRRARLVLAGQDALRDRREDELPDAFLLAQRHALGLDDPPQHVVL